MKNIAWLIVMGVASLMMVSCDEPTPEPTSSLSFEERMERDVDSLRDILPQRIDSLRAVHNNQELDFVEDTSGVFFVIYEEGTGALATDDDIAFVYYRGTLLNGITFDQNLNSLPFQFIVGANGVISGWNMVVRHFREGTKGYAFIPSPLAYGTRARSGIPANSILVFNMEVVELR